MRVRLSLAAQVVKNKRRIIALIIWWCEGTKLRKDKRWKNTYHGVIEVTNTDARIIKLFIDFLLEDLNIPLLKLKAQLQIHDGDNQIEIEEFWRKVSGIPVSQFNKTIIRSIGNKVGKEKIEE